MGFLAIFVAETGFRIIRTVQAVGADILFVPRDRLPFFHNILVMESPVKMLAPLILCIFPCAFLVIGFPIAHRLMQWS